MSRYFDFAIFTISIILCWGVCKYNSKEDYSLFSINHTTMLKGLAILTVVWAHAGGKDYGIGGIQWIAGVGVCIFLICSGYGISESVQKNGLTYFWYKRFFNIIVPYYIVYFLGGGIQQKWSFSSEYVVEVLCLRAQWFIWYVFICYALVYMVTLFEKHLYVDVKICIIVLLICFCVWFFIDSIYIASGTNYMTRARQMLSFITGVWISRYKNKFRQYFIKTQIAVTMGTIGTVFIVLTNTHIVKSLPIIIQNVLSLFTVLPLALFVIITSLEYKSLFQSKFLFFMGGISFEVYLTEYFVRKIIVLDNVLKLLVLIPIICTVSKTFKVIYSNINFASNFSRKRRS